MKKSLFQFRDFTVEYAVIGEGNHPVIALHGFNRPLEDMALLQTLLDENEFMVSIHLFHQGASVIDPSRSLEDGVPVSELAELFFAIAMEMGSSTFSLFGYSLGGRVCLSVYELAHASIPKMILFAPDGLYKNPFYQWAIHSRMGRSTFNWILNHQQPVLKLVDFVRWCTLIPAKLHRFVHVHMGEERSEAERWKIYNSWQTYKFCFPNLAEVAKSLRDSKTKFHLVMGRHDSVIKYKYAQNLLGPLGTDQPLITIDAGHILLTPEIIAFAKQQIARS
ncbi:MAG: alpha/beta hydrolase [Bacteroidota bacterium]